MYKKSNFVSNKGNNVQKIQEKIIYRSELSGSGIPLGLRSVGKAWFPAWQCSGTRKIDFIQILWTISGRGRVLIGEEEHNVGTGLTVLCLPGSRHCLSTKDSTWEYHWITIDGPYAFSLISVLQIPKIPFVVGECAEKMFTNLEDALKNPSPNGEWLASTKVYEFLVKISCLNTSGIKSRQTQSLGILLPEIEKNIANPDLNINFLSEQTGLSRFSIHRIFRDEFGIPPKNYIDSLRLQKILSLLRETDMNLVEIASDSGFANANYLTKFFRRKMHCTPSQFRNVKYMP